VFPLAVAYGSRNRESSPSTTRSWGDFCDQSRVLSGTGGSRISTRPGRSSTISLAPSDPWGAYLTALEGLTPRIEAIAVTDYYVADTYEEFLKHKGGGRLPGVHLLFPNIELRLDVAAKSGFVNIHLLVSPEDPEHLSEAKRILKRSPRGRPN
jgi:hypothetical protein